MIAAFTFLLSFKCSFSYNRYWEACTSIHQMHAKWLDAGIELGAWHLQSKRFDEVKPPTFGEHPEMNTVRKRERTKRLTPQKLQIILDSNTEDEHFSGEESFGAVHDYQEKRPLWKRFRKRNRKTPIPQPSDHAVKSINSRNSIRSFGSSIQKEDNAQTKSINSTRKDERTPFNKVKSRKMSRIVSVANLKGGMEDDKPPSLFLQEATHLISLLSAVAFTTLRVDVHKAPAPLTAYEVGSPWPSDDPDNDKMKSDFYESSGLMKSINYLLGNVRSDAQRTVSINDRNSSFTIFL
jgi:hypothetical protein